MAFEPEQRFSSADELADELQRYVKGHAILSRPIPVTEKLWRWAKRKPSLAALVTMTFAVAFIGLPIATWLWLNASSSLKIAEASRRESQASRYSNEVLLAQSYLENGQSRDAERAILELEANLNSSETSNSNKTTPDQRLPWELQYLKQKRDVSKLTMQGDPELIVWQLALHPEENQIATVHNGNVESDSAGEVVLWNLSTGQKEKTLRNHGSRVFGCAYSPEGNRLATIGMNYADPKADLDPSRGRGTLCIWDTITGKQIQKTNLSGRFDSNCLDLYGPPIFPNVKFSEDGKHIITWPGPIEVFDAATLEPIWQCIGRHATECQSNRLLAYDGDAIFERNLPTGKLLRCHQRQKWNIGLLSVSADRQKMTCSANDNQLIIWDTTNSINQPSSSVEIEDIVEIDNVKWNLISPDGSYVLYDDQSGRIGVHSLSENKSIQVDSLLGHQTTITAGVVNRAGDLLVTASRDKTIKVWDLQETPLTLNSNARHDRIASIGFNSDGREIVFAGRGNQMRRKNRNVGSKKDEQPLNFDKIQSTYMAHWPRNDFAFSPTCEQLAGPDSEEARPDDVLGYANHGRVNIWNVSNWQKKYTIETGLKEIHAITWSPNEKWLVIAGRELKPESNSQSSTATASVYAIDEDGAKFFCSIDSMQKAEVSSLAFSKTHFAMGVVDQVLTWDIRQTSHSNSLRFSPSVSLDGFENVSSIDFCPDGKRVAAADFGSSNFAVYELDSGQQLFKQLGPRANCCVRYSPDGSRLAVSGFDGIVHLCESEYGNRLLTLKSTDSSPGTISINSKVVFSPDGSRIATNNWLGAISVWSIETEKKDLRKK